MIENITNLLGKASHDLTLQDGGNLAVIVLAQLGVSLGIPLAIWRTLGAHNRNKLYKRYTVHQRNTKNRDAFIQAISMLGNDCPIIRHGGIFLLETIIEDEFKTYYTPAVELLSTFIREKSQNLKTVQHVKPEPNLKDHSIIWAPNLPAHQKTTEPKPQILPMDMHSALKALCKIQKKWHTQTDRNRPEFIIANLYNSYLVGAHLPNCNLAHLNLNQADLRDSTLSNADLSNANLTNANLANAHLHNAKLDKAQLYGTNFSNADLRGISFNGCDLLSAKFVSAQFHEADLQYNEIKTANLTNIKIAN